MSEFGILMSITLNRDLEKLDADIRQAVIDADEFHFAKLERSKAELQQKIFFAETKQMREELENLESSRSFGLSMKRDIQLELTAAAAVVADIHKQLIGAQRIYEEIKLREYFNDTQTEQERIDINDLKKRLEAHINAKLTGVTTNDEHIN